jgi:hypothetical protein
MMMLDSVRLLVKVRSLDVLSPGDRITCTLVVDQVIFGCVLVVPRAGAGVAATTAAVTAAREGDIALAFGAGAGGLAKR